MQSRIAGVRPGLRQKLGKMMRGDLTRERAMSTDVVTTD